MQLLLKTRFSHLALSALFFTIFAAFIIASCKKETINLEAKALDRGGEARLMSSCEDFCSDCGDDPCSPSTVLGAITDIGDASNNKVNMILFHYAQAVRESAKNATYRQYMENALTLNDVGIAASLLTLAENNSSFAAFFNSKLRQSMQENNVYPRGVVPGIELNIANTSWNANAFLKGELVYGGDSFDPVIYYISKANVSAANQPVTVLIAQEVNDCDDVAGWKGDIPVLVGEAEGGDNSRSVMIVGPGIHGNTPGGMAPPIEVTAGDRVTTALDMKEFTIKGLDYRYESSGRTEVAGVYINYSPAPVGRDKDNFYQKVCKSDVEDQKINLPSSSNKNIIGDPSWNTKSWYIAFYEYDWYAQEWTMPHTECTSETVKTKRKYPGEWYNYDFCGTGLSFFGSVNGGDATRENVKSKFVLTGY